MFEDFPLSIALPLGPASGPDFSTLTSAYQIQTPHGLRETGNPELELSHALSISAPDDSNIDRLNAIIRGRIRFAPATASEPAQLQLQPLPFEQVQLRERLFAIVLPHLIIYSNVDEPSVRSAITSILTNSGLSAGDANGFLNEFILGNRWLTVDAGTLLGRPSVDASLGGRRRLDLMVKDRDEFFLNPAYFLFDWPLIDPALDDHPLILAMDDVQHGTLLATKSRTIYVKQDGGNVSPYLTRANASNTIFDALIEAQSGDIVIVLDAATYAERVQMPDGVQLTSQAFRSQPRRVPTPPHNFPTISPPGPGIQGSVVEFDGRKKSSISGFIIRGGNGQEGHGVTIKGCLQVQVSHNEISFNGKLGSPPSSNIFGGGISVTDSGEIAIESNYIHDNQESVDGGGGIFVSKSKVKVANNLITLNQAVEFGGGIHLKEARGSVIRKNQILENAAVGQGGGVAIETCKEITFEENVVAKNTAGNFGGGIAVIGSKAITIKNNTIGGPTDDDGNRTTNNTLNRVDSIAFRSGRGGAGGIGVYDSDVTLLENQILRNSAHRGGGVEFYADGAGLMKKNTIKFNRTRNAVGGFVGGGDGGGVAVNRVAITKVDADKAQPVELVDNVIEDNVSGGDGGGFYATAGAKVTIRGASHGIRRNTARGNGGGVRVSFGVKLTIKDGEILDNEANLAGGNDAGGGVALRNATVRIENTKIQSNKIHNFGGGGVYAGATPEPSGGLEYVPGAPTAPNIMRDAYGFTKSEIELLDCTLTGNEALGNRGAGAGVYVVYSEFDIRVHIQNSTLSPNTANHIDPVKARNFVIEDNSSFTDPIVNDDTLAVGLAPLANYDETFSP